MVDEGLPSLSSLFGCWLFLSLSVVVSEEGFLDQFHVDEYRADLIVSLLLPLLCPCWASLGHNIVDVVSDDCEKLEDNGAQHDATTTDETPRDDVCAAFMALAHTPLVERAIILRYFSMGGMCLSVAVPRPIDTQRQSLTIETR